MRVALINPPRSCQDIEEIAPPLGLLRLAAIADQCGASVHLRDYNLLWHSEPALRSDFYEAALNDLLSVRADIYGFTSMAVDSHVAIELARRLKHARPESVIVVGGSHFSSIKSRAEDSFPWLDHIVEGEGESRFHSLLTGRPIGELDVPAPLYSVAEIPKYFELNDRKVVNLEAGRGCVFKCKFCYSPTHYGLARYFATDQTLQELSRVHELGFKHVWFVEDNFLNNPSHAIGLCREIENAGLNLTWSCYATFPQLSQAVIEALAAAGCVEIFTGIDAVGAASQNAFEKHFLSANVPLTARVKRLVGAGIKPTCAFLLSPPSHPGSNSYDETVSAALEARVAGAEVLLNPLTLYSMTGARDDFPAARFAADDLQACLMMDLPPIVIDNPLAIQRPELFPFHSRYVSGDEWHDFLWVSHCLSTLVQTYPLTLAALESSTGRRARDLAREVLETYDGWSRLTGRERQSVEQDVGFFVLEQAARGNSAAGVLGEERPSCAPVSTV